MNPVPTHIAMIMDGNGRWAKARGRNRLSGHRAGADTVDRVTKLCRDAGVKYLTLYAFSTENWKRPAAEVNGLMKLLKKYLDKKEPQLIRDRVRFRVIGRKSDLPASLVKRIEEVEERTKDFDTQLIIALSYGGRAEIVDAAKALAKKVKSGQLDADEITESVFSSCLYAPDIPDPDLIVRTSGEMRISNFLLWECAYSEFYITPVLWPDFGKEEFDAALAAYASRDRRKGGLSKEDKASK